MVTLDRRQCGRAWPDSQFVGNHPALDFVNTLSHRVDPALCEERLETPADLQGWAIRCGLRQATPKDGDAQRDPGARLMIDARHLRGAAHQALLARIEGREPPVTALVIIAEQVSGIGEGISFAQASDLGSCAASGDGHGSLLGVLSLTIFDALFRLPAARLGACPACGWLFHDVTRGGRRRWCSMATCGNRTKVRRHRGQVRDMRMDRSGHDA